MEEMVRTKGEGERGGGEGARRRERYEIRNWARESCDRAGCRPEDGPFALARREVGGSLVLSSWEVAADVPTRLARARCHLAAKKTVPSAPSSPLPPPGPHPLFSLGPRCPLPYIVACVHASFIAATGQ